MRADTGFPRADVENDFQRVRRRQVLSRLAARLRRSPDDVNPILPYLDRVIYVARGSAVIGTPESVITADQLSALYGIPIEVLHDRAGRLFVVGQPDAPPVHTAGARE